MTFQYTNAISELKTLLSTNWNLINTDNIKPNIDYIYNKKRIDSFWNGDWVLLQRIGTSETQSSFGNTGRNREYRIYIDVRSDYIEESSTNDSETGISHLSKIEGEISRIIDTNVSYSFLAGCGIIEFEQGFSDNSDGLKGLYRSKAIVKITKWSEAVS